MQRIFIKKIKSKNKNNNKWLYIYKIIFRKIKKTRDTDNLLSLFRQTEAIQIDLRAIRAEQQLE